VRKIDGCTLRNPSRGSLTAPARVVVVVTVMVPFAEPIDPLFDSVGREKAVHIRSRDVEEASQTGKARQDGH
jgi:hypothetical protein